MNPPSSKLILVIQTAFLGDLLLSIPFLMRLRQSYPDCILALVCKKGLGDFLLEQKIVDKIYEVEKGNRKSYELALERLEKVSIRKLFCLHRSIRSLIFSLRIKAEKKIGFDSLLGKFIFSKTIRYNPALPDVIRQMNLLAACDGEIADILNQNDWRKWNKKVDIKNQFLTIPEIFRFNLSFGDSQVKVENRKIVIFPGSVWETKRWTTEGYVALVKELKKLSFSVFLLGSNDEVDLCNEIVSRSQHGEVLAGQLSLTQSIHFLRSARLVICNDSGASHMASTAGRPSVVVFGPTTLDLGFRPWHDRSRVVEIDLNCRPCGSHGHKVCPIKHHNCMKNITATMVLAEINIVLDSNPSGPD